MKNVPLENKIGKLIIIKKLKISIFNTNMSNNNKKIIKIKNYIKKLYKNTITPKREGDVTKMNSLIFIRYRRKTFYHFLLLFIY